VLLRRLRAGLVRRVGSVRSTGGAVAATVRVPARNSLLRRQQRT